MVDPDARAKCCPDIGNGGDQRPLSTEQDAWDREQRGSLARPPGVSAEPRSWGRWRPRHLGGPRACAGTGRQEQTTSQRSVGPTGRRRARAALRPRGARPTRRAGPGWCPCPAWGSGQRSARKCARPGSRPPSPSPCSGTAHVSERPSPAPGLQRDSVPVPESPRRGARPRVRPTVRNRVAVTSKASVRPGNGRPRPPRLATRGPPPGVTAPYWALQKTSGPHVGPRLSAGPVSEHAWAPHAPNAHGGHARPFTANHARREKGAGA